MGRAFALSPALLVLKKKGVDPDLPHFFNLISAICNQNDTLALSCISRPGVIAIVIVPNCGVFTKRFGVP